MKPYPLSIQLYSVREAAALDPAGVIRQIADFGYPAVEAAGLYDFSPADFRALLDSVGLKASSIHGAMPTAENVEEIVASAKTIGYEYHISGFGPDQFATLDSTLEVAAIAQQAAELLKGTGVQFGIHNHWWEFDKQFDGKYPHEVFMAAAPDVLAQVDTYWVKVGGADPVSVIRSLGARAPLLHIKDGPGNREQAMTAVGGGIMDWAAIMDAAGDNVKWIVVELDSCDTDMLQAVHDSYTYLVGNGFAQGNK
ncbi:MAG TPA: sugar phosphate isomerase/epimerase [Armatimonadota bacterium]|jgi:sugar phosphate isomerase/epimerase